MYRFFLSLTKKLFFSTTGQTNLGFENTINWLINQEILIKHQHLKYAAIRFFYSIGADQTVCFKIRSYHTDKITRPHNTELNSHDNTLIGCSATTILTQHTHLCHDTLQTQHTFCLWWICCTLYIWEGTWFSICICKCRAVMIFMKILIITRKTVLKSMSTN